MGLKVYIPDVHHSFYIYTLPPRRNTNGLISVMGGIDAGVVYAFSLLNLLQVTVCMANQSLEGKTLKAVCLLNKSLGRITSQQHHLVSGLRLYLPQPRTLGGMVKKKP